MSFVSPIQRSSRIFQILIFAIGIHILFIWLLISGLAQKATAFITQPMNAQLIEEIKHIPKPEIPKPKIIQKVYVAKTEIQPPPTVSAVQATIAPPPETAPPAPPSAPVAPIVSTAKIDMSGGCQRPQYPEASRIEGEQGSVIVGFLIGMDGRIKDNKILSSSGFRRLDIAARDALELCKFQPGTENGKPIESWAKIKYVWRLN